MPRINIWMMAFGLVLACSFAAGYLLLSKSAPPEGSSLGAASAASSQTARGNDALEVSSLPADAAPAPGLRIPTGPERPRIAAVAGMICSFDGTIYDLRIAPDQIARLDADALTKAAATPETFQKALAALGSARALYRASLTTTLNEESYTKVSNTPPNADGTFPPTTRSLSPTSQPANATGAIFDFIAKPGESGALELDIAVKASYMLDFAPPATISTSLLRSWEIQTRHAVIPMKPFLLFNADASTLDGSGKAVLLITRVVFGVPHFAADEPGAAK